MNASSADSISRGRRPAVGFLRDKYLTSGKYPSFDEVDVINVLEPERGEILARLKRQH